MKTILSVLIAGVASIGFIGTATAENSPTKDSIAADYNAAKDACKSQSGYDKSVCLEQAKASRAHAEADWAVANNQTASYITRSNNAAVAADYSLAKAKCKNLSGTTKSNCMDEAKSAHTLAVNSISNKNQTAMSTDTTNNTTAPASTARCDNLTGSERDTCLANPEDKGNVVADAYITTKVKADLIKEPNLKSMDIHVETVQGAVQLTGFVNSEADASRAAELALSVKGVKSVRNDIKINK